MLLLMGSCQEWDALHIRILNRKKGGGVPILLPFDINQLKASLRLLLHLFSFALKTASYGRARSHLLQHNSLHSYTL